MPTEAPMPDEDGPVRYPDIEVELIGGDSNAMVIIGTVNRALRRAGVSRDELDKFQDDAMSGDYDHVLMTVQSWVEVV